MEKKTRTIDFIKQNREIPESVQEERKKFNSIRKIILDTLKEGAKSIPQIYTETNISTAEITYYLMTLQKFGKIIVNSLDDMDEYYSYELKKK